MRPSRDKSRPMHGRSWYEGSWQTPEMIERARERARARYARRVEDDPTFLPAERERNRARYAETYVPKSDRAKPGVAAWRKRIGRGRYGRVGVGTLSPRPTPQALREAATIEAVLELVEESIRDDARRYVYGYERGLGQTLSLDAPLYDADEPETFLDRLADPTHWREPGYEAA